VFFTRQTGLKKVLMKKNDIFLIAAAVLLTAAAWLLTDGIQKKDAGDEVIVFKDGEVFYAGLLSVETTINIEDEKGNFNIVHIKDGKAVMKKASCPDQICVHTRPAEKIKAQIERQKEKYGWEFIFLGANIDAVQTAGRYGIAPDRAIDYLADSEGTELNFKVMASAVATFRESGTVDETCFEEIRKDVKRRGGRK
jgi:hypothetical protein